MAATTEQYPVLGHHFDDLEQQRGSARLGMWLFLMTEVLFFGGVITAFIAYRMWYPVDFQAGASRLLIGIAGINTLLLLTSSLTMTLAIHNAQRGERSALLLNLALTAALGIGFLALKAVEYNIDFREHLIPGKVLDSHAEELFKSQRFMDSPEFQKLSPEEQATYRHEFDELPTDLKELYKNVTPQRVSLFFLFYYSMTGLHVVHLLVGIGIVIWLLVWAYIGRIPKERYPLVEISSLYWHFVDLLWLFLLALLYLSGPHHGLFS
jgi:cytochrome c oxidase subunit 3